MKVLFQPTTDRVPYQSPTLDTLDITVEKGFAGTGGDIEDPQKKEDDQFWY